MVSLGNAARDGKADAEAARAAGGIGAVEPVEKLCGVQLRRRIAPVRRVQHDAAVGEVRRDADGQRMPLRLCEITERLRRFAHRVADAEIRRLERRLLLVHA